MRVASHSFAPPLPPKPVGFRGANNYTFAGAELTLNHADALVQLQNAIFSEKKAVHSFFRRYPISGDAPYPIRKNASLHTRNARGDAPVRPPTGPPATTSPAFRPPLHTIREESPHGALSSRIGAIAPRNPLAVDAKASTQGSGTPLSSASAPGEPNFATPAHIVMPPTKR